MSDDDALKALYPFLHGARQDSETQQAALRQSVADKARHSLEVKQGFFERQSDALIAAARDLADCYRNGGKLLSMGNGGSSCDASHVAVEFQHPVTAGRPSLPAFNLGNDLAFVSAVANDIGVRHVFARQIEAHGRRGDCLIGFSTSGNSENLMAGFAKARELGLLCIGFAGGNGGEMLHSGLLDHCLVVETDSIHRVQETHVACYHILWDLVHSLLADDRGHINGGTT